MFYILSWSFYRNTYFENIKYYFPVELKLDVNSIHRQVAWLLRTKFNKFFYQTWFIFDKRLNVAAARNLWIMDLKIKNNNLEICQLVVLTKSRWCISPDWPLTTDLNLQVLRWPVIAFQSQIELTWLHGCVQCTLYSVHCTVYIVQLTLYTSPSGGAAMGGGGGIL